MNIEYSPPAIWTALLGADTEEVPVNLMSWPHVRSLRSDHKLIYLYLWCNPDTTVDGVYCLDVERCATVLDMTVPHLDQALDELARRRLIARRDETGEVAVLDKCVVHLASGELCQVARQAAGEFFGLCSTLHLSEQAEGEAADFSRSAQLLAGQISQRALMGLQQVCSTLAASDDETDRWLAIQVVDYIRRHIG
ncbi:hypothetical protein [Burkholderia ubonensis]|uniref:hypothetical protein n=1 Tax=Burkholderia ubonensis TaxID=101571 RepID=UPI002AB1652C|nr:hypothetical protein [Burkholderia ubonensis]